MPTTTTVIDHLNAFNHNTMFNLTEFKVMQKQNSFFYNKCIMTNVTFVWLFSRMNNISINVTLYETAVVANITFEWLFFFMN